jgi:MFS transporter, FSR family, fosmidomycin resistance protein
MIGIGSAIFHPEASRVARIRRRRPLRHGAVGVPGRRQHGDQAIGPLLAAFIVVPLGQARRSPSSPVAALARHA